MRNHTEDDLFSFFSLFLFILKNTEKISNNAYGLAKQLLLVKMIYLFYFFLCTAAQPLFK